LKVDGVAMATEELDYAKTYSEMEDEELLKVARDATDLVPAAKAAIDQELRKRGLKARIVRNKRKAAESSEAPETPGAVYVPPAPQHPHHPYHMKLKDFEAAVAEALDSIPEEFRRRIENVAVLVEDLPPQPIPSPPGQPRRILLGLFHGVPRTQKSVFHGPIGSPDYVVLYKKNIESICSTEAEVREQIRLTIIHELGHYFGMSEEQLRGV
jgi:predicted Zn-dependent protease with MMP-like domain